ncbi:WXG100 family type VII secretion target [Saccharopolyspora taberi]|uniref:WXG100 family type VII secretion target n=1 Tax=Saccharopolyspora taberi TaxID=60895 RepID=A0ABN3VAH7_9PSEU
MADGMQVNPDALRSRSPKFAAASEKLAKAFEDLKKVQDAEGKCWGSDEAGNKFDEEYTKALEDVEKGRKFLVDNLKATKDELDQVANQWEADDKGSAENLNAAGGNL